MLTLKIKEQNIVISNPQKFVKGTVGAKCKVVFDPCWKNYNRTIVFKQSTKFGGGPITVYVPDMTSELTIPWEVMVKVGSFKIGAYGTTDELTTPTLWCEPIEVVDGTDTTGKAPQEPSTNVYNQLIDIANEAVSVAQSIRADADSGKFDGDDYVLTEADKKEIADMVDVVGGDGTTDYEKLDNKPKINGVELVGDKKPADLGCVPAAEGNTMTDQVYVVGPFGETMTIEIEDNVYFEAGASVFSYCIPRRNFQGNLITNTPTTDLECVNKKYVDNLVGDIDTALDELHNYAQALINGGAV